MKYNHFFHLAKNPFAILDTEWRILDANLAFAELFDCSAAAAVLSKKIAELTDLNLHLELQTVSELLSPSQPLLTFQYTHLDQNGHLQRADFTAQWQAEPPAIYLSAEATMNTSPKPSSELNAMIGVGFWEYDMLLRTFFWSSEASQIYGAPISEIVLLSDVLKYYHPEDIPKINTVFSELLKNGTPYDVELRVLRADGDTRWVRVVGQRTEYNGKTIKITGLFQDIHHRKTAEIELTKSRVLLRQVLDSLPVGVFWKDLNGVYQGLNGTSLKFLNHRPEDVLNHTDTELINNPELLALIQAQDVEIKTKKIAIHESRDIVFPDGKRKTVDITKLPLLDKHGDVFGILGVYIDTTQTATLIRSLDAKNYELQQLLFAVSHDLKEPLQGINRFAQLLRKRFQAELPLEANQILDFILQQAKYQYTQFEGLTRYLEVGNRQKSMAIVAVAEVIGEVIQRLYVRQIIDEQTIISFENMPSIFYNAHDLRIIFNEFFVNAIKYRIPERKMEISVKAQEKQREWLFSVSDTGQGFDMAFQDKIFQVFKKLDGKHTNEGVGIGLSICKKIIEQNGGSISVQSVLGVGTTFLFSIPKTVLENTQISG